MTTSNDTRQVLRVGNGLREHLNGGGAYTFCGRPIGHYPTSFEGREVPTSDLDDHRVPNLCAQCQKVWDAL